MLKIVFFVCFVCFFFYLNYPTTTFFFTFNLSLFCLSLQVKGAVVGQVRSEVSAPKELL